MRRALLLMLAGCPSLHRLPDDQPCLEAGYAISSRTFDCTGDPDLANDRYLAFQKQYDCVPTPDLKLQTGTSGTRVVGDTGTLALNPPDAYHCSFEIRELPCELVEDYGDDLDRWLSSSDACAWVVEPAGGGG